LEQAQVLWEASGRQPVFARQLNFPPTASRPDWIEMEACFPDGRRVFAISRDK
jgi:hypothetical protein